MTFLQSYWLISQMAEAVLARAIYLFLTGSTKDEFPSKQKRAYDRGTRDPNIPYRQLKPCNHQLGRVGDVSLRATK